MGQVALEQQDNLTRAFASQCLQRGLVALTMQTHPASSRVNARGTAKGPDPNIPFRLLEKFHRAPDRGDWVVIHV